MNRVLAALAVILVALVAVWFFAIRKRDGKKPAWLDWDGWRHVALDRRLVFPVIGLAIAFIGVVIVASVIGPSTPYLPIGLGMLCMGTGMGFAMPTTSIAA